MADKWISVNIGGKVIWKNATTGDVSETQPAPPAKKPRIRKPKADAEPSLEDVLGGDGEAALAADGGSKKKRKLGSERAAEGDQCGIGSAQFDDPLS